MTADLVILCPAPGWHEQCHQEPGPGGRGPSDHDPAAAQRDRGLGEGQAGGDQRDAGGAGHHAAGARHRAAHQHHVISFRCSPYVRVGS